MSAKVSGLDGITKMLDSIESNAIEGLGQACALVERAAKKKAPKNTGELRRTIASKVDGTEGIVYAPAEYAPYVEYGTGLFAEEGGRKDVPWHYQDEKGEWHSTCGMSPQPFLRPALNENKEKILKVIKKAIKNG